MKKVFMVLSLFLGSLCSFMSIVFLIVPLGRGLRGPGIFVGALGIILLLVGLFLWGLIRLRIKHLKEHGRMIAATIKEAHLDYRHQVNQAPQLLLRCQGTDSVTGITHEFHARIWSTQVPQESLRGYEIDILFDPLKPEVFEVFFQTLRRSNRTV